MKNQTPLGVKAKSFVDAGQLVPDEVVIGMVEEVVQKLGKQSFILDGFPRTVPQAAALEALISKMGMKIGRAVFLEVPKGSLMRRLTGRRVCNSCGAVYHVDSKPSKKEGVCDACGGQVAQRKDDHESVIGTRLEAYEKSTSPLKQHFAQKGILAQVDGLGETEEVYGRLVSQLS